LRGDNQHWAGRKPEHALTRRAEDEIRQGAMLAGTCDDEVRVAFTRHRCDRLRGLADRRL